MKDITSARTASFLVAESTRGAAGLCMQEDQILAGREARPSDRWCGLAAWLRRMTCAFVPWKAKPLTPLALLSIIASPGDICARALNINILP